jgi:hypothetical protein
VMGKVVPEKEKDVQLEGEAEPEKDGQEGK